MRSHFPHRTKGESRAPRARASVTPLSHSVGGDKMREKVTRIISVVNGEIRREGTTQGGTAKKSIAASLSAKAARRRRFAKAMPFFHGMDAGHLLG